MCKEAVCLEYFMILKNICGFVDILLRVVLHIVTSRSITVDRGEAEMDSDLP